MFDFIRTHTRLVLGFMLLLIIPSFVFFGVQGYSSFIDGSNETVAKVAGRSITRAEWEAAHQRNIERVRRQMPNLDAREFDTPALRRETLDGMLRERVLMAAATDMHLAPSDGRLQRLFVSDPQFAELRNPDGSVRKELLAAQGMSSEMFAQQLRQEFAMQQVLAGVTRTAVAPPATAAAALDPLLQRRELQVQRFEPTTYRARINPADTEIEAYYKAQQDRFTAPEQAGIEYVVLDLATVARDLTVGDAEVRKFYDDNAARYTQAEERRASHILIKADKDLPAAQRQQARSRAEALLAEARRNPAGFADLARKNSQDEGSAAQGGDLDFFARGAMVKPFEDAAFALKVGEISEVVESDFGFHVITLTAVRGGQKKPLESVRAEIEAEARQALAQKRWPELAEQFTNMVYEQSDSLRPVAEKLKLEVRTATVQRTPQPGASGALASVKLLDAVFGREALENKRNTDAVEFGINQLASARVVQHMAKRVLPLDEVRPRVRQALVDQQAQALARQEGQARLSALQKAPGEALATVLTVSRVQPQGLPREVIDAALRVDAAKLPAATGVDLGAQGYVVLRVMQVLPREAAPGGDAQLQAQVAQTWAAAESEAYLQALKKRYKSEVRPAASAVAAELAASAAR